MNANLSCININPVYHTDYNRDKLRRRRNMKRKRIQDLKRRLVILFASIIVILFLSSIFGSFLSNAQSNDSGMGQYKYFTSYTVRYDDTMWEIALKYMDGHYDSVQAYIEEVEHMNRINADEIRAGSTIMLPYYSDEYLQ